MYILWITQTENQIHNLRESWILENFKSQISVYVNSQAKNCREFTIFGNSANFVCFSRSVDFDIDFCKFTKILNSRVGAIPGTY